MKHFIYCIFIMCCLSLVSCLQKDPAALTRSDIISGEWQLYTYAPENSLSPSTAFSYALCSHNCKQYNITFKEDNQFELRLDEEPLFGHYKLNDTQDVLILSMGNRQYQLQIKEFDRTWMMTQEAGTGSAYLSAFREVE